VATSGAASHEQEEAVRTCVELDGRPRDSPAASARTIVSARDSAPPTCAVPERCSTRSTGCHAAT